MFNFLCMASNLCCKREEKNELIDNKNNSDNLNDKQKQEEENYSKWRVN